MSKKREKDQRCGKERAKEGRVDWKGVNISSNIASIFEENFDQTYRKPAKQSYFSWDEQRY